MEAKSITGNTLAARGTSFVAVILTTGYQRDCDQQHSTGEWAEHLAYCFSENRGAKLVQF